MGKTTVGTTVVTTMVVTTTVVTTMVVTTTGVTTTIMRRMMTVVIKGIPLDKSGTPTPPRGRDKSGPYEPGLNA